MFRRSFKFQMKRGYAFYSTDVRGSPSRIPFSFEGFLNDISSKAL